MRKYKMNKFQELKLKYFDISALLPENERVILHGGDNRLFVSTDLKQGAFIFQLDNTCINLDMENTKELYEFLKGFLEEFKELDTIEEN